MNTLKIKTKQITQVEKEYALPYFSKNGQCYVKVITPISMIAVKTYGNSLAIEITDGRYEGVVVEGEEISEDEFNQAYNHVLLILQTGNS